MTGRLPKEKFPLRPRLVFMGTPEFAVPSLRALIGAGHNVVAVVSQPDRPRGRGRKIISSPVKQVARDHGLETLEPEEASDERFCAFIRGKKPDLIIVVAFGQILKKNLLEIPRWGIVNVHASLLPKLRGAAPIQWAILKREPVTGLTIMRMDEGLDTGPILFQAKVPILDNETAGHLHDRLAQRAGKLIVEFLEKMVEDAIVEIPQDHSNASYAPKIEPSLYEVDWRESAEQVSARIRAFDPRPGAYTLFQGQRIKLFASRVVDAGRVDVVAGKILAHIDKELLVETGRGVIAIREMQYPGRKKLPVDDFLRGFLIPEGSILGK
ncbi:MAG: methionyl-tRNA formyltransferase [Deltaproteobacteria bacterium]|nr:methionyl-tRNA formyltransferase [Deltaproteobacteria bacterium]RLB35682.1 MAG: methionyl-tRNA formyltransferase [Deltaproteobacteria bacterium]